MVPLTLWDACVTLMRQKNCPCYGHDPYFTYKHFALICIQVLCVPSGCINLSCSFAVTSIWKKKMLVGGGTATSSIIGMDAGSKIFFYSKCILYAWKPTLIRINEAPCLNLIHCLIHPWYLLTCGV